MKTGAKRSKVGSRGSPTRVVRGSGNVFEDLGLLDSAALMAKAELASRICGIIEKRGLIQVEAAQVLGVSQPKVSALRRGHLDGFSSDRLFRFLNMLGRDVEIVIRPRTRSTRRPSVRVVGERLAG